MTQDANKPADDSAPPAVSGSDPQAPDSPKPSAEGDAQQPPKGPLWAKLLLVFLSLMFVFGVFEVGMRIMGVQPKAATVLSYFYRFDPDVGWRGKPDVSMVFAKQDFAVLTSQGPDGFRVIDKPIPDPVADAARSEEVWVLGDSGAWGWGVADGEVFIDYLNTHCPEELTYRNMAFSGYASVQQYLLVKSMLEAEPDRVPRRVMILLSMNDLYENLDGQDQDPPRPYAVVEDGTPRIENHPVKKPSSIRPEIWLRLNSVAYNNLYFYYKATRAAMKNRPVPGSPDAPADPPQQHWDVLEWCYAQLADLCAEHGIEVGAVYLPPIEFRFGKDTKPDALEWDDRLRQNFRRVCTNHGIAFLDVTPHVRDYYDRHGDNPPRLWFEHDAHFNVRGHELIGKAILALRSKQQIPRDSERTPSAETSNASPD